MFVINTILNRISENINTIVFVNIINLRFIHFIISYIGIYMYIFLYIDIDRAYEESNIFYQGFSLNNMTVLMLEYIQGCSKCGINVIHNFLICQFRISYIPEKVSFISNIKIPCVENCC